LDGKNQILSLSFVNFTLHLLAKTLDWIAKVGFFAACGSS